MWSEKRVNEIIKELRLRAKVTQKELAEQVGLSQQAIALIESGKRKVDADLYFKIIDILDPDHRNLPDITNSFNERSINAFKLFLDGRKQLNADNDTRHHLLTYYYDEMDRIGRDAFTEILAYMRMLNEDGQCEAAKRVEELTEIKKYQASPSDQQQDQAAGADKEKKQSK